jgi:hypothetical protein
MYVFVETQAVRAVVLWQHLQEGANYFSSFNRLAPANLQRASGAECGFHFLVLFCFLIGFFVFMLIL